MVNTKMSKALYPDSFPPSRHYIARAGDSKTDNRSHSYFLIFHTLHLCMEVNMDTAEMVKVYGGVILRKLAVL